MQATIQTAFANRRMEVNVLALWRDAEGTEFATILTPGGTSANVKAWSLKPIGCLERMNGGLLCGAPIEADVIKDSNFETSTVFCVDHAMKRIAAQAERADEERAYRRKAGLL